MDEYLRSNKYVIIDEVIRERTTEVIGDAETAREAAVKIFYYIRNSPFVFGPPTLRTSVEVLERFDHGRPDHCIGKAVLQAATLRAAKIPARFRLLTFPITGWIDKEIFMSRARGQPSCHPYVEAYLNGKWIACDATVDPTLGEPWICNDWSGDVSVKLQFPDIECVDTDFVSPHLPLEEIRDLISRYKKSFPSVFRPFAFRIGDWIIRKNMNKFRKHGNGI